ncbi:MAG: peroxiredoxin family protein [Anaerolineae bacterium]
MAQTAIAPGQLTPYLVLPATDGSWLRLSDYRGRRNLVLVFAAVDCRPCRELLSSLAHEYTEFRQATAEVVAVVCGPTWQAERLRHQLNLPFLVLADEDGQGHKAFGATGEKGAVYVSNRYGELYAIYHPAGEQPLPTAAELLEWLQFIEIQCPE